jgi:hypothetical protein
MPNCSLAQVLLLPLRRDQHLRQHLDRGRSVLAAVPPSEAPEVVHQVYVKSFLTFFVS